MKRASTAPLSDATSAIFAKPIDPKPHGLTDEGYTDLVTSQDDAEGADFENDQRERDEEEGIEPEDAHALEGPSWPDDEDEDLSVGARGDDGVIYFM